MQVSMSPDLGVLCHFHLVPLPMKSLTKQSCAILYTKLANKMSSELSNRKIKPAKCQICSIKNIFMSSLQFTEQAGPRWSSETESGILNTLP